MRRDLMMLVASQIADRPETWVNRLADRLIDAEYELFFAGLKALYAGMPYGSLEGVVHEGSYERILKAFLQALGLECRAEDVQAVGRADVVASDGRTLWIFELKVDATAAQALAQIREKDYAAPYRAQGLPVYAIGLAFDSKTRMLVDADCEKLQ